MNEQDTTGILSEEDDLVEDYVDDIRHGKNRNVCFNEYKKRVIESMTFPNQAKQKERKAKQVKELEKRSEASRKVNGGGEEE